VLVTHHYKLDDIVAACDLFAHQRDGVLKIAVKPGWKGKMQVGIDADRCRWKGTCPNEFEPTRRRQAPSAAAG
jgi:hypothetical protein